MSFTRRRLLEFAALGVGGLAFPRLSWALGESAKLDVAELKLASGTLQRPRAWERLLFELIQTTSVEARPESVALAPDDLALFDHPIAALIGNGPLPPMSDAAVEQLSRYLQYGGFLLVDDSSGLSDSAFDESFRALCRRLFPAKSLSPISSDHSIYRTFFLLDAPLGRVDTYPYLEGITLGETTPIVYCRNDLTGALDRREDGLDAANCVPGGEWQRRESIKLGINLIMYALTSNYKKDLAHVRRLQMEGRIE